MYLHTKNEVLCEGIQKLQSEQTDRQTDMTESITFLQTMYAGGKKERFKGAWCMFRFSEAIEKEQDVSFEHFLNSVTQN